MPKDSPNQPPTRIYKTAAVHPHEPACVILTLLDISMIVGVNKELSISVHVSNGDANIKSTHLEKAYQSTPVL